MILKILSLNIQEYSILKYFYINKQVPCNSFGEHELYGVRQLNKLMGKGLIQYSTNGICGVYEVTPEARECIDNFWK